MSSHQFLMFETCQETVLNTIDVEVVREVQATGKTEIEWIYTVRKLSPVRKCDDSFIVAQKLFCTVKLWEQGEKDILSGPL